MKTLKIKINSNSFEHLWDNSMAWAGTDWQAQAERFEPKPKYNWKYAYWFESYPALLIARAFLESQGKRHAIHSDEAGGWVLLTNFASPCWSK